MEITKIYSDPWGDDGRKYYSVLLSDEELRLFSEPVDPINLSDADIEKLSADDINKLYKKNVKEQLKMLGKHWVIGAAVGTGVSKIALGSISAGIFPGIAAGSIYSLINNQYRRRIRTNDRLWEAKRWKKRDNNRG